MAKNGYKEGETGTIVPANEIGKVGQLNLWSLRTKSSE